MKKADKKIKVVVAMSPYKSLRDSTGQAGGARKPRVVVAMSGGVDSSVAAAILKKQGYNVVGVFMRFWKEADGLTDMNMAENGENPPHPSFKKEGENSCCSEGAEQAARNVAAKLKIPFYVLDLQKEFKKLVVDYFLAEQKRGLTPNPCVVCNKKIKFGLLFKKALKMEADFVATGHYARINPRKLKIKNEKLKITGKNFQPKADPLLAEKFNYQLLKGRDLSKDQSYFLYGLSQKQLSRVIFPLGDYRKEEVYQMAKKMRLPFRKGESFDLCFISSNADTFLRKYLKTKPGKIMDYSYCHSRLRLAKGFGKASENGNPDYEQIPAFAGTGSGSRVRPGMTGGAILGEHQGLHFFTIGQRKNLPLQQGPWWVVKKDERKNILYVSRNEKDLYGKEIIVNKINWINSQAPKFPLRVLAKIRYKSEAARAILRPLNSTRGKNYLNVIFKKPQRAITPGQSLVFYSKNGEVLGGGVIK